MERAGPQDIIRLISTAVCTVDHESGEAVEMAARGRLAGATAVMLQRLPPSSASASTDRVAKAFG